MALDSTKVLAQLAEVKRYLQIGVDDTADDRLLDELITVASVVIRNDVGCDILETDYTNEIHDGDGGCYLFLDNWPIVGVDHLAIGTDASAAVTYSGSGTHATIEVRSDRVRVRSASAGVWTTNEFEFADYATITLLTDAITALSGWSVNVVSGYGPYPSTEFLIRPALSALDREVDLLVPEECETDYEIFDAAKGVLYTPYSFSGGPKNVFVTYTAGYTRANIPEPLRSACAELVALVFRQAKRDTSLTEEKIGDYSYKTVQSVKAVYESSMLPLKTATYRRPALLGV